MIDSRQARVPIATYRLQFNRSFQFDDAREILPYLRDLGISDVYASPVLRAGPESTHGYDVCSQEEIDPKLGGPPAFAKFLGGLKDQGLGLLLDFVPNHMRADTVNNLWRSVLEEGRDSRCGNFFDIDWNAQNSRVLLPVLEDRYARVLEAGKIKLTFEDGAFWLCYYEHRFPASLATYQAVAKKLLPVLPAHGPEAHLLQQQIEAPPKLGQIKVQWREMAVSCPALSKPLAQCLRALNGAPGQPRSFDELDRVLERQHYRLCWWRLASEEINYRRFFDITDLVCLNAQDPKVFEASHRFVRNLIATGVFLGLRIDHPDGLWDPREYFTRLQTLRPALTEQRPPGPGLYVVAEKILSQGEHLPLDWPVAGTTGYEFLNQLNGIFIDASSEARMTGLYQEFTGVTAAYDELLFNVRRKILYQSFYGQLASLVHRIKELAAKCRRGRDFTLRAIETALANFICSFPTYRTYITQQSQSLTPQERQAIEKAAREGRLQAPDRDWEIVDFIQALLQFSPEFEDGAREQAREFAMKLQQLTAPLAAKGLEDTVCYVYTRLISLNEVGGDPGRFGGTVESFHLWNLHRAQSWPHTLLATSTHDTKRGEDVRARLDCLSELPEEWAAAAQRWSVKNRFAKTQAGSVLMPSRNEEYLLYQTLVGAWPAEAPERLDEFRLRVIDYAIKAAREAKEHTCWTDQNETYETALKVFVERILSDEPNDFLEDLRKFQERVSFFGRFNSLSQVLLKTASPGAPDFYQGTELWDLTLVDPDNRRPIDYEKRRQCLIRLQSRLAAAPRARVACDLLDSAPNGDIKFYVTWQALQLRRARPAVFTEGEYIPLSVSGVGQEHLCVFLRRQGPDEIIAAAPRLVCKLTGGRERAPIGKKVWQNTFISLPAAKVGTRFHNVFTGREISVAQAGDDVGLWACDVFAEFPVALLETVSTSTNR